MEILTIPIDPEIIIITIMIIIKRKKIVEIGV